MNDSCVQHIENHWKSLTVSNNEFFNQGHFQKALAGYKDALYRAEILNNNVEDCLRLKIPFIQVYTISCNNLANTYEDLGQKEEAENMLKRVVYYLLHLAANPLVKAEELQSELKKATLSYIRFAEKTNPKNDKQEQLFKELKEQLKENNFIKIN